MADMLTEYKPNRPLRSLGSSQLEIPRVHTKQGESAFSYYAARSWNQLPEEIKCAKTLATHRHLGNARISPGHSAVEGSEDGGGGRAASGREKGPSTTSSAPYAPPGRKAPGQGTVVSHAPLREINPPAARAQDWAVC